MKTVYQTLIERKSNNILVGLLTSIYIAENNGFISLSNRCLPKTVTEFQTEKEYWIFYTSDLHALNTDYYFIMGILLDQL